ncbi:MAG TPA: proline/glycine betaine ABC transporter permease [Ruania sp.]|nr:proline/glycine betaine ABC transporter permease [Ruania sp.]
MNEQLFEIPLGTWVESFIEWVTDTFAIIFDFIKLVLETVYGGLLAVLGDPPFLVIAIILAILAFLAKGWKLALGSLIGFFIIDGVGQWQHAMESLSLVVIASVIALVVGIPVGIWAARNETVSAVVRPILDFLQTMPAFVYLIPVVVIFLTGPVPGMIATVVFGIAPGIRFTELGIRQVDKEVVEAGQAFGSPPRRILREIQVPLALPTIMGGVNQVIMLALSMVVIAGMVGAGGLGEDVYLSLTRVNVGLGFEAGLAVVILAMYLDRITAGLSDRSPVAKAAKSTAA